MGTSDDMRPQLPAEPAFEGEGPADPSSDPLHPRDRHAPLTRRRFLGLAGLGGLAALGGGAAFGVYRHEHEAPVGGSTEGPAGGPGVSADPSGTEAEALKALGPEPASYTPPAPESRPPVGSDPFELRCQVCVVGGGAAGAAAATIAGRMGVETVLLEESFVLGGNVTRGLVNLDKVTWGGQQNMVGGYFRELLLEMEKAGQAVYPTERTHWAVPFEVDAMRHLALVLARRSGADVRFGAQAVWVERDQRQIKAVWAQEQGRLVRVLADVYIDCTGDGNLGYLAGNGYWLGDRERGEIQGQTLIFYAGPVDWERLVEYAGKEGSLTNNYQVIGLRSFMSKIIAEKRVEGTPQRGLLINRNMEPAFVSISASEIYSNHLEPGTLPRILTMLQTQDYQIHSALKAEVPGFGQSHIVRLAERPYLREGRRLIGYKQLDVGQVLRGEKPADSIARGWYPIDLHVARSGGPVHLGSLRAGDWYGIPYACLVARDIDNLLMSGRCISVTHEALGSTRISPVSMSLGQAAGIAAALSASQKKAPARIQAGEVQREIIHQGGFL